MGYIHILKNLEMLSSCFPSQPGVYINILLSSLILLLPEEVSGVGYEKNPAEV